MPHADYNETYNFLNSVGPGFCLAKWSQVTIHLGIGLTHSCHHVAAHKIPLDELAADPSALHNTQFKKNQRKMMLKGQRPPECDYCWRIEDNTNDWSDRVSKSAQPWSQVDKDTKYDWTSNFNPRYVEVSFSNVCNFKCSYCGPPFSSQWAEEIKTLGPIKTKANHYNSIRPEEIPIPNKDHNPYIEAFWKWFPEAVKHMFHFRITGGEPLLSKHTDRVLDYLLENPQPNLNFAINTNACPPNDVWEKFVQKIKVLVEKGCVKKFRLFTSAESYGRQAEYSRFGMDWTKWQNNMSYYLKNTEDKTTVTIMSALNILSLPTLKRYLKYVDNLKSEFGARRVETNFAYVRHPHFLDVKIASDDLIKKHFLPAVEYMDSLDRYKYWEKATLKRIYNNILELDPEEHQIMLNRYRFYQFVNEYDKRRGTNFVKTFPEYAKFYKRCSRSNV